MIVKTNIGIITINITIINISIMTKPLRLKRGIHKMERFAVYVEIFFTCVKVKVKVKLKVKVNVKITVKVKAKAKVLQRWKSS